MKILSFSKETLSCVLRKCLMSGLLLLSASVTHGQAPYPDAMLSGDVPELFAEQVLDASLNYRDFTISPSGDEIFVTVQLPRFLSSTIIQLTRIQGNWSVPVIAPFSGQYRDLEAMFSADGKTVYFSSDRPLNNGGDKKDFDIWKVTKSVDGNWEKPENLGPVVNSAKNEFYPSVSKNGNLYFTVEAGYGKGKEDIVVCKFDCQKYMAPESLPDQINSARYEFNAFVDPDEQFIIFTADGRQDDLGGGDLSISRKDNTGKWMPAKHLPGAINSAGLDYCPYVSPDKQILIFTSNRTNPGLTDKKGKGYEELMKMLKGNGNGTDDMYWVKFGKNW